MIHEPVGCLGQPHLPEFNNEDLAPLSDEAFEKVLKMAAKYKARIDSQCKINEAHDEIHAN